ncbi:MAG: hypothetical protein ACK4QW_03700 [Alphaproteobacteria bacterium]
MQQFHRVPLTGRVPTEYRSSAGLEEIGFDAGGMLLVSSALLR